MNDDDFKKKLNPEQYRVMREKDTERPFSGKYWDYDEHGLYACVACGTTLFTSLSKFDAENGHPTFNGPISKDDVVLMPTSVPSQSEVLCKKCSCHLGYTNEEVQGDKKEIQYVINSAALDFIEMPEIEQEEDEKEKTEEIKSTQQQTAPSVSSTTIKNILLLLSAVLAGGLLGNVYASGLCSINANTLGTTTPFIATTTSVAPAVTAPVSTTPASSSVVIPSATLATTTPADAGGTKATSTPADQNATSSSNPSDGTI